MTRKIVKNGPASGSACQCMQLLSQRVRDVQKLHDVVDGLEIDRLRVNVDDLRSQLAQVKWTWKTSPSADRAECVSEQEGGRRCRFRHVDRQCSPDEG